MPGDPNFVGPPDYDQRGPGFDRVRGGRIDVGSFEVQKPSYTYCHSNCYSNSNTYAYRHSHIHTDFNGDANSYTNFDTETFTDAQTRANAQAVVPPHHRTRRLYHEKETHCSIRLV